MAVKLTEDDIIDMADTVIGGEFTVNPDDRHVELACDRCKWSQYSRSIPLWELVTDARRHWQEEHA